MAAMSEISADIDRLGIGANGPPDDRAPDPFGALQVNADDLLDQARGVTTVATADQLDAVNALADDLKEAAEALEGLRVEKKKPLDEQIAEIQATFNVYLAPLTNKSVKGKIPLALDALKKAKEPYLVEQDRLRREAAETARIAAERAAQEAAEAARSVAPDDMESREAVEALVHDATAAQRVANKATKATTTGTGLKSVWTPELTDATAALRHYMNTRPDALRAWLVEQAQTDIAASIRTVPGFTITEQRVAR